MIEFDRIHTKLCWLGASTEDDGRKSAIDDKDHLIGQYNISTSDYFSSTLVSVSGNLLMFLSLQDSLTDYIFIICFVQRTRG